MMKKQRSLPISIKLKKTKSKSNTPFLLYHVTLNPNIQLIKKNGFDRNFAFAEADKALEQAKKDLDDDESTEENDEYEEYESETSDIELTREIFNDIIDQYSPNGFPSHSNSIFFWNDKPQAESVKNAMQMKNREERYGIISVDLDKIPCKCYEANNEKGDELFDHINTNINIIEQCNRGFIDLDKHDRKICNKTNKLAQDYVKTIQLVTKQPNSKNEIICPCNIPNKSIIAIDDIRFDASQKDLNKYIE